MDSLGDSQVRFSRGPVPFSAPARPSAAAPWPGCASPEAPPPAPAACASPLTTPPAAPPTPCRGSQRARTHRERGREEGEKDLIATRRRVLDERAHEGTWVSLLNHAHQLLSAPQAPLFRQTKIRPRERNRPHLPIPHHDVFIGRIMCHLCWAIRQT